MSLMRTLSFLSLTLGYIPWARCLSCVDESGKDVDWWFMVKHPADSGGDGSGADYVFATSSASKALAAGSKPVTDSASLLGKQLADIYSGTANYVFYNDQLPNRSWTEVYGHSKGFFAYEGKSGFWVQHSIPHFPNYAKDGYLYGHGQEMYGQHAFCLTMSAESINEVAGVMKYSNGWIYDHKTDGSLSNVEDIVNGKIASSGSTVIDVATSWGKLKLFGKTSAFDKDMVQTLVAPTIQESMLYQSWLNSGGPLGHFCPSSGFDVFDIKSLRLSSDDTHDAHEDHSKWGVAKASSSAWFCGIDNNHVKSQYTRSGLAVCAEMPALSALMRGTAAKSDTCQSPSPSPSPSPPSPGPPSPKPGNCCFYRSSTCSSGQVCCSAKGASYRSASTCSQYGGKHNCKWTGSQCVVGGESVLV